MSFSITGRRALRDIGPGLTALLLATVATTPVAAAESSSEVSELIVTAQKREQRAFDVPISLSVISGASAAESGVSSTLDLANLVPGLAIGQNSGEGDFPYISLRGVTMRDFADTNESPSAVYINEFYKANLMGLDSQTFDLARIEVLRGPQGTLYGRNATGGLINLVAAAPTKTFQGYVSGLVGERDRYKAEGAVSGPLSDTLSARLSIYHHEFSGYTKNVFPGAKNGNALNASAVRGQLQFEPSESFTGSLFLQYYENDNEAGNMFSHRAVRQDPVTGLSVFNPGGVDSFGYRDTTSDPRDTNSNRDAYLKSDQLTAIGKLSYRFGGVELTSITGYEEGSKDAAFDSDSSPNPRGTEVHPKARQYSQELRLSGETDKVTWVGGLYYFNYDVKGYQRRQTVASGPRAPVYYDLESESWAVFGNVDYALTPTVTLTGGLRYTSEKKKYALNNTDTGPVFNTTTVGDLARRDDGNTSFTARASWKPSPDQLYYAGVARSFKAGTFNVGYTSIARAAIPVKPEELTSYETGAKFTLMEGLLSLSGAAFYYDYKDSQAYQFDGLTMSSTTFNRDASIKGAELEFTARPVDGLSLSGSASYIDATLKDVQLPARGAPVVDTRMPLAPKWSGNLTARYTFAAPFGGSFALQGDVAYKASQYFDAFNSPSQHESPYVVGNVRASWTDEDGKLTLAAFAENVGDTKYRTAAFDLSFLGQATEVWGKPQWFGVTASYKFGQ